jgi:hypothetical protein
MKIDKDTLVTDVIDTMDKLRIANQAYMMAIWLIAKRSPSGITITADDLQNFPKHTAALSWHANDADGSMLIEATNQGVQ